ncbi:hypothetical protein [Tateyamaria sp. SN6-1]|uniref:hypothetical protein n=1 Tax=Tateyamaria sp. SN6-1 TaxID=3092148 RepID=UPI0039F5B5DC
MPLHILIILVVGGIAGVALALHLLGRTGRAPLAIRELKGEWRRHFPDDTFEDDASFQVLVNAAGNRGLLRSDQSHGLIWSMGADTAARRLPARAVRDTPRGLDILFDDPGAPRISVRLGETEKALWRAYLEKIHAD